MQFKEFVDVYEALSKTTKRLEKIQILSEFLRVLKKKGKSEWIYLLRGRVIPDYDEGEFGISQQLVIKAISVAFGISSEKVVQEFKKKGDLGEIAYHYAEKRRQTALFSKRLEVGKAFEIFHKILEVEGKGAVDRKMGLCAELLSSADSFEAKYIIRILLSDLRIGVASAIIVESISSAFYFEDKEMPEIVQHAFDMTNDFAVVFDSADKGKKALGQIHLKPGRPLNPMLAVKAESIQDAFEICGRPAAFEYKYDGFRLVVNKDKDEIKLFTRKLENVSSQFPDIIDAVKKNIHGESFILDAEAVGFDPKTGKYKPFEAISQRIKRKYNIKETLASLPVELNVFDIIYYNGESKMDLPFLERREILKKIIKEKERVIRLSEQIVTDKEEKAEEFYAKALKAGEEGLMIKNVSAPYKPGRRVGYMAKLKPEVKDLDLVIVGAEYGTGKRGGWLSSFIVACRDDSDFREVGRVSSGLKEKEEEGTSYTEMTKILKPLITKEDGSSVMIKPKIVVSVTYQNIQKSPSYSSGYALRFPRITAYRPDRKIGDIQLWKI